MKIGRKLMISVSLLALFAIGSISFLIGINIQKMAETNAETIAQETAYHYANTVKSILEQPLVGARTTARFVEGAVNSFDNVLTREQILTSLKYLIEKALKVLGLGIAFEPNALDSKDSEYADEPGHDSRGRIVAYAIRNDYGTGSLKAVEDIENRPWYKIPKETMQETITEPERMTLKDKEYLIVSCAVPIFNIANKVVGVSRYDIALDVFQGLVAETSVGDFKSASLIFLSSEGTVVAGSGRNAGNFGKPIFEVEQDESFLQGISQKEPFIVKMQVKGEKGTYISCGVPVPIGSSGLKWAVIVQIPEKEIYSDFFRLINTIITIGAIAIVVSIMLLYFLSKTIVRPSTK